MDEREEKENYEVEHTLDFETIIEDLGILCRKNGGRTFTNVKDFLCNKDNTRNDI